MRAPGQESRHNLLYWRYGEYAGVGPGAHSRLIDGENRRALIAEKHPETWRDLVRPAGPWHRDETESFRRPIRPRNIC